MRRLVIQSISLTASFAFVFVWQNSPMSQYTLALFAVLSLAYVFVALRRKKFDLIETLRNELLGLMILNTVVVLLIMMSGNFSSPLFFLLYFLSFGIAFAYEPAVIFVFTIGMVLLLLPFTFKEDITRNLLMVGSLAIIAPVAFFFGQTFLKNKK